MFDAAVSNKAELATGNRGIISGRGCCLVGGLLLPCANPRTCHPHPASNPDGTLPPASRPASSRGPAVLHQTGMRDLDFLDGKGSDEISGFQLWQSRPSALSAFALSAVGPCQQNSNPNVTSHPLHLAACHHRPSFFHPSFFTPLVWLFSHACASALPLAGPWKLPASSPFRCTLPRLLAVPSFVRPKVGTKKYQGLLQHA